MKPKYNDISELEKSLTGINLYYEEVPEGSILGFGDLCTCNTGAMCEHRRKWVIDWVKKYVKNETKTTSKKRR